MTSLHGIEHRSLSKIVGYGNLCLGVCEFSHSSLISMARKLRTTGELERSCSARNRSLGVLSEHPGTRVLPPKAGTNGLDMTQEQA